MADEHQNASVSSSNFIINMDSSEELSDYFLAIERSKRSGTRCSVKNCSSKVSKKNTSFFCYPNNTELRKVWIQNCGTAKDINPNIFATRKCNYKVCSLHFEDSMFLNLEKKNRLKPTAYPTLFFKNDKSKEEKASKSNDDAFIDTRELPPPTIPINGSSTSHCFKNINNKIVENKTRFNTDKKVVSEFKCLVPDCCNAKMSNDPEKPKPVFFLLSERFINKWKLPQKLDLSNNSRHICDRHFHPNEIVLTKILNQTNGKIMNMPSLKLDSIPTLNMCDTNEGALKRQGETIHNDQLIKKPKSNLIDEPTVSNYVDLTNDDEIMPPENTGTTASSKPAYNLNSYPMNEPPKTSQLNFRQNENILPMTSSQNVPSDILKSALVLKSGEKDVMIPKKLPHNFNSNNTLLNLIRSEHLPINSNEAINSTASFNPTFKLNTSSINVILKPTIYSSTPKNLQSNFRPCNNTSVPISSQSFHESSATNLIYSQSNDNQILFSKSAISPHSVTENHETTQINSPIEFTSQNKGIANKNDIVFKHVCVIHRCFTSIELPDHFWEAFYSVKRNATYFVERDHDKKIIKSVHFKDILVPIINIQNLDYPFDSSIGTKFELEKLLGIIDSVEVCKGFEIYENCEKFYVCNPLKEVFLCSNCFTCDTEATNELKEKVKQNDVLVKFLQKQIFNSIEKLSMINLEGNKIMLKSKKSVNEEKVGIKKKKSKQDLVKFLIATNPFEFLNTVGLPHQHQISF